MASDIILLDELVARADAGGSNTREPRSMVTSFMDSYEQVTFVGMKNLIDSIAYTITGNYDEVNAVNEFLAAHIQEPFWYRFVEQAPARLYDIRTGWDFSHVTGLRWRLSATFTEAQFYQDAQSTHDVELLANKLHQVVNVILPVTGARK